MILLKSDKEFSHKMTVRFRCGLEELLANLNEKYASDLDIDKLLDIEMKGSIKNEGEKVENRNNIVVGNQTGFRTAGSGCARMSKEQWQCSCTPYKQNDNGIKECKIWSVSTPGENDDYRNINNCSYLRHEFEQAKKKKRTIIIVYNSTRKESSWLPSYMSGYEDVARPFWKFDDNGRKVGDYSYIKGALGF